ncbi:MAG: 6-phosphofructokinase, partial [Clostridia bacterium]|nr:6-phosphofructokinase [Clostridia bacterium]
YMGAKFISELGFPCIGLPGTIDNDIAGTDATIGFDTAMNTACEMTDKLRDTVQSHCRCSIVEVMGRHAGYLAYEVGTAVGATAILVPEVKYDLKTDVIDRILAAKATGKKHFIIVVAENLCDVDAMAKEIEAVTGVGTRPTVLGHVQRGGNPTVRDRVMATKMGFYAVELLKEGIGNRVIAYKQGEIVNYDIYEALNMKKNLNADDLHIAHRVSR